MSSQMKRTAKWLLAATAVFEAWAGLFLLADRRVDMVACSAGLVLTVTALLILLSVLLHAPAALALLQVLTVSYELVLLILIATSLYMGMRDSFLIGVYFSALFFFIMQSMLLREIVLTHHQRHYEDIENGSTF